MTVNHTRDPKKDAHIHLGNGDIVYTKDHYSIMKRRVMNHVERVAELGEAEDVIR